MIVGSLSNLIIKITMTSSVISIIDSFEHSSQAWKKQFKNTQLYLYSIAAIIIISHVPAALTCDLIWTWFLHTGILSYHKGLLVFGMLNYFSNICIHNQSYILHISNIRSPRILLEHFNYNWLLNRLNPGVISPGDQPEILSLHFPVAVNQYLFSYSSRGNLNSTFS